MEFIYEYQQIGRDYSLTPAQKLQYLPNILKKHAQQYYLDCVQSYTTTFEQAVDMISHEYNSPVSQTRVKNYLNSLRVSNFVAKELEISVVLSIVYKLLRQVPPLYHGDAHRIEFLRNAFI